MYCRYCGAELQEGTKFCPSCGQPTGEKAEIPAMPGVVEENSAPQYETVQEKSNKASATPGFVCSVIGIFFAGLILGIIGLVLSNKALNNGCDNEGLAKAGKIIGIIDICICGLIVLVTIFA